jgi:2',3'-cyclic-nucleotide 2'-phosphodiesterase (5'-nucleotidase family)
MNKKVLPKLLIFAAIFALSFCTPKWKIVETSSTRIAINSTKDTLANKQYINYLQTISEKMNEQMNVVIGQSVQKMNADKPESLLSNFASDLMREVASQAVGQPVDIGIMNLGGLRTQIPQGDVTVRNMYELMPFENELVVIWLRGDTLQKVINEIAAKNGEGVSGIKMTINNKNAENVTVGGKIIDNNKLYTIATNDFMAGGNDELYHLRNYVKIENTGLLVRDIFIETFKNAAKQGKIIDAHLDGRITIKN